MTLYQRLRAHSHVHAVGDALVDHKPVGNIHDNGLEEWANACAACGEDDDGQTTHLDNCPRLRQLAEHYL